MKHKNTTLAILAFAAMTAKAQSPAAGAKAPSFSSGNVISLFSDAYTNKGVDTWRTPWSSATLTDTTIASDNMKRYSNLDFVGIETTGSNLLDVSGMNYFHVDFWTSNATTFRIKLVDFGADKSYGGGDDTEHEISVSSPAQNQWVSWHIPMSNFVNLQGKKSIAQLIFSAQPGGSATVFIDNLLFTTEALTTGPNSPSGGAETPSVESADVISLFSNAYQNVNMDTWRTGWSNATLTDTSIASDNMKRYSNLDFVGVEATGANQINASTMKYFHIDFWTNNATTFRVKLVDWGADKSYGGGDDSEHELVSTGHATGEWVSWHIPMTSFANLKSSANISQIIFSAQPAGSANVFIDNVFFTKENSKNPMYGPKTASPVPTANASQVISLFSNAYTNKNVDTWRTPWSNAAFNDTIIASDNMKHYGNLDFVGVEATGANMINASTMTHFNIDFWTVNATTFRVKLVDWGANGAYGGGDDTEHEIASTTHPLKQWNSWKIALSDFTGLTAKSNIAQIIFSGLPTGKADVYLDNIYFSNNQTTKVNNHSNTGIRVYPNPACNEVILNSEQNINRVAITDLSGKVLLSESFNTNNYKMNISGLTSGIYLMQIETENGKSVQKLIKE
jgi:hypothetical protein